MQKKYYGFKQAKRLSPFSQYAVAAAKEAFVESGIRYGKGRSIQSRCKCGLGNWRPAEIWKRNIAKLLGKRTFKGKTFACANDDYKYGSRKCGYSDLGLKGKCVNIVTACATGTHCYWRSF